MIFDITMLDTVSLALKFAKWGPKSYKNPLLTF